MDQVKIGAFIQQRRKEKGMTQKELAESLHISDKTISKWETGKGMPDVSILTALCELLEVNVNEILAGEKLNPNEYSKKSEDNILSLLKENHETKNRNLLSIGIGTGLLILGIIMLFAFGTLEIGWYIDPVSFACSFCICAAIVLISGKQTKSEVVVLLRRIVIPVGLTSSMIAVVCVMGSLNELSTLGAKLSVSMLSILYSVIAYIILMVIEQRMKE